MDWDLTRCFYLSISSNWDMQHMLLERCDIDNSCQTVFVSVFIAQYVIINPTSVRINLNVYNSSYITWKQHYATDANNRAGHP